jgi:hypothetical protein
MATNILPVEFQSSPKVPEIELEDLLIQADPRLEDDSPTHLQNLTAQLRDAIEPMLLAYRQSIYLGRVAQSIGPKEQWELSEIISSNYRQAFQRAAAPKSVGIAFQLFIQNMRTEEDDQICATMH